MKYKTIGEMFFKQSETHSQRPLFWVKKDEKYEPISWTAAADQVNAFASALLHWGHPSQDKIAILAENRYEWAIADLAILSLGMPDVPIYPSNTADQCRYILEHSGSTTLVVSTQAQLDKILSIQNVESVLKRIIVLDPTIENPKDHKNIQVTPFEDVLSLGKKHLNQNQIKKIISSLSAEDIATLIYTSGTTGNPKGVCLTHKNFLSNVEAAGKSIRVEMDDRCLSFLPLSHVFERMCGYYMFLYAGAEIAYAETMDTIAKNMTEIQPTVVLGVPRFYEKLYTRIQSGIENAPKLRKALIQAAINTTEQCNKIVAEGKAPSLWLKITHVILDKVVMKKLKAKLGGRLKYFCSGGAALSPDISASFAKLGLTILQGYGLTESSPVITVNKLDANKPASVGQPIEGVEVKIAADGEILSRGPHIMRGYYNDSKATAEAIDEEGWLHTGDIGHLDADNFLHITDRKKDIIVTSGGKNIAPAKIENMLKTTGFIENAMIIGDSRRFISALIVPNKPAIEEYAKKENLNPTSPNLLQHPKIQRLIDKCVQDVNAQLASFEQVKKYKIVTDAFSIETGDLTPTMKIKKNVVSKKYHTEIEAMYNGT